MYIPRIPIIVWGSCDVLLTIIGTLLRSTKELRSIERVKRISKSKLIIVTSKRGVFSIEHVKLHSVNQ